MTVKLYHPSILIAVLALLWAVPASAEDAAAAASLSLQDCIEIAMKNQVDVLVGENTVTAAKARRTRALSEYYPQVTAEYTSNIAESGAARPGQTSNTFLSVSQNFYDGGLREAKVRRSSAEVSQNQFGLERFRQIVTFSVTSDYFSLLRVQHLADVQRARVTYLEGQLALVQTRVRLGDAAEVEAFPVEAQLANARVDLLSAENNIRTSAIQLQNTMGLSPAPVFSVQEVEEPASAEIRPVDDYVAAALAGRPDVRETQAGVKLAKSSVESAKITLRPRPVIFGQYERSFNGGISDSVSSSDDSLLITGGLVYDIFNGGYNRAAYREELTNLSNAELRTMQMEKDIQSEVQQAYLNLKNAEKRIAASDLSLKAAQKNFDAQEGRYKQGLAIPLDLLNAQFEVVTARSNAVQARYDYYTSIAQLEYAIGKPGGLYGN
ncbi:MAG TPA: TolC family protein [Armatimonadota bacterium]|nr:TolC family protein [Armatimonadota bacterium]